MSDQRGPRSLKTNTPLHAPPRAAERIDIQPGSSVQAKAYVARTGEEPAQVIALRGRTF
jgi:hypothetical protein